MATAGTAGSRQSSRRVIAASSLGTVFEWYDFYLYGLLATHISTQFFSGVNETTGFILALGAFAAGFAVRPFGALVFGRIGDIVGRKNTFLVTMAIMGLSTFAVGLLPSYAAIGIAAPIILVLLRLLQGLALGGEYGGAATYVAEHAPEGRRGLHTSFIQTTATLGLFAALLVVIGLRLWMGEPAFADWGWRLPFLLSILLLAVSLWIRLQLEESPVFREMKAEGTTSKAPLSEAFGRWPNMRLVLIVLFGAVAGQAVVWYTGQFYALFFLEKTLKVDGATANMMIAVALALGTPFFIFFGWLSDRIGRKPIILTGCAAAALAYFPLFAALTGAANPALADAQARAPVTVTAPAGSCAFQFDPVGRNRFESTGCDIAKAWLAKAGIGYATQEAETGAATTVAIGPRTLAAPDPAALDGAPRDAAIAAFRDDLGRAMAAAGYPASADPARIDKPRVIGILFLLVLLVTTVYGPIAALLVEIFPSRIRYTSMSLPYHIGNGWFGGFLPTLAFAMVAATGDIYYGLWYPVVVAALTVVIGLLLLPETFRNAIHARGASAGEGDLADGDPYGTRTTEDRPADPTTSAHGFDSGDNVGDPYGTRTRVFAVRGRRPRPLDEGAVSGEGAPYEPGASDVKEPARDDYTLFRPGAPLRPAPPLPRKADELTRPPVAAPLAPTSPAAPAAADAISIRIESHARTHEGKVRKLNEDRFIDRRDAGLWAVADGMGGHSHGDWASQQLVDALAAADLPDDFDVAAQAIVDAINAANRKICAEAEAQKTQMGSTIVALLVRGRRCGVFWIGDSRAYVLRGGQLEQISRDHSQVQEMVDRGMLTAAEAENHPMGHILTRAVGVRGEVEVARITQGVEPGDIFLLSSDGLHGYVDEPTIVRLLGHGALDQATLQLVDATLERGAPDNVTMVAVAVSEPTLLSLPGTGAEG